VSSKIHTLYFLMPSFLKDLALTANLALQQNLRYGSFYKKYLEIYTANFGKSQAELEQYQLSCLKALLLEISVSSPHYKSKFQSCNLTAESIQNATSVKALLAQIPILEKADLRLYNASIQNQSRKSTFDNHTSGTSGSPTLIKYDDESLQIGFALWRRFHNWIGLPPKPRSVRLSGKILIAPNQSKAPFWVYNYYSKQLFMSVYHLTDENMKAYIEKLNSFKPAFIDAYPSAIYILACYINKNNIQLNFKLTAIATTAETLYSNYREEIERAFDCPVYNQYSSSEGGPFIVECPYKKLHINVDSGVFEFINMNNEPAQAGEIAELMVTSLRQWKTPLIRYRTGDWLKLSAQSFTYQKCACGCSMPVVEEIIGRQEDILYTREKGLIGRMDPAYKGLNGIVKSKIIQHSLDFLEVVHVVDKQYTDLMEQKLIKNLRDRLGDKIEIKITIVAEIPLGASGKFKAVERKFEIKM
jgi:phenylacetate-CoA ligase